MDSEIFTILAAVIDVIFFLDMLVNFRTSFIDDSGDEISEPCRIAKEYLKFYFWIDFLATVPMDSILEAIHQREDPIYEMFGLFKFGRLFKLKKIIQYLNIDEAGKSVMNLLKLVFFLLTYLHLYACLWWYIVKEDETWVAPKFLSTSDWY